MFISNVWFPTDKLPHWLNTIAKIFPIHPLADGLQYAFDPRTTGVGLKGSDLRSLAIWTVIGIIMMVKFLRQPQGETG
jgi:ABC-type multidrug transport system permease subunit